MWPAASWDFSTAADLVEFSLTTYTFK